MKNLKVSMKLIVSFLIVVILAVAVGLVGIFGMLSITNADTMLYEENTLAVGAMGEIRETLQRQRVMTGNLVMYSGNDEKTAETLKTLHELETKIDEYFIEYEKTITDQSKEEAYYNAKKLYQNDYAQIKNNIIAAAAQSYEAAYAAQEDAIVITTISAIVDGFTVAMQNNDGWAKERSDNNDRLAMTMTVTEIVVLAVAVAVAMFFAFYISGLISKPLATLTAFMNKAGTTGDITLSQEDVKNIEGYAQIKDEVGQCIGSTAQFVNRLTAVANTLESVAGGDLTVELPLLSNNDVMGISLQKMLENLNSMFGEINAASMQVSTGSSQIADGAQTLAQGATEQSATVQELSASVTEIAAQTKHNAKLANEAKALGDSIKESAEQGSRQMEQMIQSVGEISAASQSIGKVIKIIDDIAFQTNILALNAAVEAARAGQHGKGFAVVADEVRSLAAKSAEAAKNTSEMIETSIQKSEMGARISSETSASLTQIVEGILKNSELVSEISRSSVEQATAISQVSEGIEQVSQVVQQNSATSEQNAAASEEMSGQAGLLQQLISQFKLKGAEKSGQAAGIISHSSSGLSAKHVSPETGFAMAGDKY